MSVVKKKIKNKCFIKWFFEAANKDKEKYIFV